MRKKYLIGNWKMNLDKKLATDLTNKIKENNANNTNVDIALCPPSIYLSQIKDLTKGTNIKVGAQNFYCEDSGAFTGEISPLMLKDTNIDLVIIGHSERREIFGEPDALINKKVKSALKHNLTPIVCVGESLTTRENGKEIEWVKNQILKALEGLSKEEINKLIIAYEPIWAIGTGKVCNASDANTICTMIRETIKSLSTNEISENVRILYGGSVKSDNFEEITNYPNIDGGLVGGASLKGDEFNFLIKIAGLSLQISQ